MYVCVSLDSSSHGKCTRFLGDSNLAQLHFSWFYTTGGLFDVFGAVESPNIPALGFDLAEVERFVRLDAVKGRPVPVRVPATVQRYRRRR